MERAQPELEIGRGLARRLLPFTLVIGLVVSVGLPVTYYVLQSRALTRTATFYAQELVREFRALETQGRWKDHAQKYLPVLGFAARKDVTLLRVRDEVDRAITDFEVRTASGDAWWNHSAPVGSAALVVDDRTVAIIEVGVARGAMLGVAAVLLLLSTAMGAGLALLVYVYPLRVVRRLETRVQRLAEAGQLLASTLDLQQALDRLAGMTHSLIRSDLVFIWLLDDDDEALALHAQAGTPRTSPDSACPVRGQGLTGRILTEGGPLAIADVRREPTVRNRAWFEAEGIQSFLGVPLLLEGRAVGLMICLNRTRREWSTDDIAQTQALATTAAVALRNARLYNETGRRLRQNETLLAVSRAVSSTLDFTEAMRRVARETGRALGADMVGAYLADPTGAHLRPIAGYRVPPAQLQWFLEFVIRLRGHRLLEESAASGRPVWSLDAQADDRVDPDLTGQIPLRSVLFFPMVVKGEFTGGLFAIWWAPRAAFAAEEITLVEGIASQAALALENARLFAATQAQAQALKEKNAELDSFVYTVSHDLKAPLVTIQGMASILCEDHAASLDGDGRHYLDRIQANCQQMERLILDLLALSRVGREARAPEVVRLPELVDDVLAELAEPIRARGVKVSTGDLGSLWALRVQMEQVFRNLLSNAVKYMGDGAEPTIEIGMEDRGAGAECWVRDNGIGIDAEYHAKVFEIFQRLKEVEAEGSGVGLPIVKKIVEAAGGRIWVESARGQGSTFHFTWPHRR